MVEFVQYNQYIMSHQRIDKNLLPFLRLYIANKECRSYCVNFNSALLHQMDIDEQIITNIEENIQNIPFQEAQKTLLLKVLKAIYEADKFDEKDLKELQIFGFSDKDFFDLLSYATNFMGKSKMIEVYLK